LHPHPQVPFGAVGLIIGRGGESIRNLIKLTGVEGVDFKKLDDRKNIQVRHELLLARQALLLRLPCSTD
jgi:hypothetical protein